MKARASDSPIRALRFVSQAPTCNSARAGIMSTYPQGLRRGAAPMPDLTAALKHHKLITAVPNSPPPLVQNNGTSNVPACTTISAFDVLERAAVLEYCEGLPRAEADARALAELTAAINAAIG